MSQRPSDPQKSPLEASDCALSPSLLRLSFARAHFTRRLRFASGTGFRVRRVSFAVADICPYAERRRLRVKHALSKYFALLAYSGSKIGDDVVTSIDRKYPFEHINRSRCILYVIFLKKTILFYYLFPTINMVIKKYGLEYI